MYATLNFHYLQIPHRGVAAAGDPSLHCQSNDWECEFHLMKWMYDLVLKYRNDKLLQKVSAMRVRKFSDILKMYTCKICSRIR